MKYQTKKTNETEEKENKKEKFDLKECFTLWKNTSKEGNIYLSGYDFNHNKIIGFFTGNKTNEKQPDIRIYAIVENNKLSDEIISLWNIYY